MMHIIRLPACAQIKDAEFTRIKTAAIPSSPVHIPANHQPAAAAATGPSGFQTLAGMGGRRWAGIGALAGGALGALSPGKDDDGESRGAIGGALHGALAGGLAGGLGGMAAKRMWGPSAAQKLPGQLGAQQAGHEMQLGKAQQGISQGLGKGVYSPSGYDALRHQGHGVAGSMWKSVMPRWLGGSSGFEMAKAKNNLGMSRELQQLEVGQNHAQAVHGITNPKGAEPAAAPSTPAAAPSFEPVKDQTSHLHDILSSHGLGIHAAQNPHAMQAVTKAHQYGMQLHPNTVAALNAGLKVEPQYVQRSAPAAGTPTPPAAHGGQPQTVQRDNTVSPSATEPVKTTSVLNPMHVFSPLKKAARQPFKMPKKTVATRVNEAFTAKPKPTANVETPKPPTPPKAETPAQPADAPTPADKTDKTAAVAVPAIDVVTSAVSDVPAAAPVAAAVADVAKVAEVVAPVVVPAVEPTAEPLIRPIKLAALAQ